MRKIITIVILAFSFACEPERIDEPIPFSQFADVVLNLNLPENQNLNTIGAIDLAIRYPGAGVRGIIVYKKSPTTYLAFEKNCSFQPNDACATVEIHSSSLFMQDPCCGSSFSFEGKPTGGLAWRSLQQYQTILSGTTLTITDAIVD